MKLQTRVLITALSVGSLIITTGVSATAAEISHSEVNSNSAIAEQPFSDRDVIEFLAFGAGPIDHQFPGLIGELGYEELSEEPQDEAVDTFLAGVMSVNPEFNTDVTARLQSGDPIAVEAALTSYNDSALEYVQTSDEWAGTLKDDGTGTANCLVIPLAVAVALVVAVVSTRIVTYVGPGARGGRAADDNRLTRQDASAAIAMTIHS